MPNISSGGRTKRLEQDLKDMTILARRCPAIKFKTLDSGNAPQKYEVSFYLRTIIGVRSGRPIYREADKPTKVVIDLSDILLVESKLIAPQCRNHIIPTGLRAVAGVR